MAENDTIGSAVKVAIAADGTALASFMSALEFINFGVAKKGRHKHNADLRGTMYRDSIGVREDGYDVNGSVTLPVSPGNLDILLPYMLGAAEDDDDFLMGSNLDSFEHAWLVDYDPADTTEERRWLYDDCKVTRWTLRGSADGFIELVLDITGRTAAGATTAFPSIVPATTAAFAPYQFSDVGTGLELGGTGSREVLDFELVFDWAPEVQRRNNTTVTRVKETESVITARFTVPFGNSDLFDLAVAGAAAELVLTNGSLSTTFAISNFKIPTELPAVQGKGSFPLVLNGEAFGSGSTKPLSVTNVSA